MSVYIIKYDVLKEELLPAGYNAEKEEYSPNRTTMLTLGNGEIRELAEEYDIYNEKQLQIEKND